MISKKVEDLITTRELCEMLICSNAFISNNIKKGLPCFKVGGRYRFNKQEVIDWLKENYNQKSKEENNKLISSKISRATKIALAKKKHAGEWLGRVPFGFKLENRVLVKDEEMYNLIHKAKRLFWYGHTQRYISRKTGLSLGYVNKAVHMDFRIYNNFKNHNIPKENP